MRALALPVDQFPEPNERVLHHGFALVLKAIVLASVGCGARSELQLVDLAGGGEVAAITDSTGDEVADAATVPPDAGSDSLIESGPEAGVVGRCLAASGNLLVVDGEEPDPIVHGVLTSGGDLPLAIAEGEWSAPLRNETARVEITVSGVPTGPWNLFFSDLTDLTSRFYSKAGRYGSAMLAGPGLQIAGGSTACVRLSGEFTIHRIAWSGGKLREFVVGFKQTCDGRGGELHGCVHYRTE